MKKWNKIFAFIFVLGVIISQVSNMNVIASLEKTTTATGSALETNETVIFDKVEHICIDVDANGFCEDCQAILTSLIEPYTVTNPFSTLITVNGDDAEATSVYAGAIVTLALVPISTEPSKGYVSKYDAVCSYSVSDSNGNSITIEADGTFIMPESDVIVNCIYTTIWRIRVHSTDEMNMTISIQRAIEPIYDFEDVVTKQEDEDFFYLYAAEGDVVTLSGDIVSAEHFLDRLWFLVEYDKSHKTLGYVENSQSFIMSGEMVKIEPKFGYKFHTVEYTTDSTPYIDADGNIVISGTNVYTTGERGIWEVPDFLDTYDYEVIPTVINAVDGYYLVTPSVFYYGADNKFYQCDEEDIILDLTTGELTVKYMSQSIVIYYTFDKIEVEPEYIVTLPATIVMEINSDDISVMRAELPIMIKYQLSENDEIKISIPNDFTIMNQDGDILRVTANKYNSSWTNYTDGVTSDMDGYLVGRDSFILYTDTMAGAWTGSLTVNIDVITE